ncbi:putative bifunctional diguanylate cyclase/phosphodiesterase [Brevibacillus migulae]|uniref:putative bifunctional diguanylate cyclase/phosphodiesterase n=1 Tax=Brevibacillus migulae TaxID=1644114 RepID=UPI00143225A8|nr:GGDEF domain-containing phosphodiesterase [Brevibacillus migulae]
MNKICNSGELYSRDQKFSRQFDVFIDHITDAVDIVDLHGNLLKVNHSFESIYGWKSSEIIGKQLPIIPEELQNEVVSLHEKVNNGYKVQGWETTRIKKDGTRIFVHVSISPLVDEHGGICGHIGISRDITAQKKQVNELIFIDQLTHIPNRIYFFNKCKEELNTVGTLLNKKALLIVNIDRFSQINESFGQSLADRLLREVAVRLLASISQEGLLARLGGDEFAVFINEVTQKRDVTRLVKKILLLFHAPFYFGHDVFEVSASIGSVIFPDDGQTFEQLLRNANTALDRAKKAGGNTYRFYERGMESSKIERFFLGKDLKKAISQGELEIYYQPIIHTNTAEISGLEALIRWNHPRKGWVSPTEFIPIAEETGLISSIGLWIMRKACDDFKKLHEFKIAPKKIAVNVSPLQLENRNLTKQIRGILRTTGLKAEWLELEITESVIVKNNDATKKVLSDIAHMGVRISIDDFGTGYSSLNYLKRLPIHNVKIDKSFIQSGKAEDEAIIKAIISISHELQKCVIAEGIETPQHLEVLKRNKCDYYQGYLASKPMPFNHLVHYLREQKRKGVNLYAMELTKQDKSTADST